MSSDLLLWNFFQHTTQNWASCETLQQTGHSRRVVHRSTAQSLKSEKGQRHKVWKGKKVNGTKSEKGKSINENLNPQEGFQINI